MASQFSERIITPMAGEQVAAIDDYRFAHRISSRAEAMRRLLTLGLAAAGVLGDEVPLDQVIARLRSASED